MEPQLGESKLTSSTPPPAPVYDLGERTARFSESIIEFCKSLRFTVINRPLIDQTIRSATSVGANYCEADESVSRKEFRCKIGICKKEACETKYWLRLLATAEATRKDELRALWTEVHELHLIFCKIFRKVSAPRK